MQLLVVFSYDLLYFCGVSHNFPFLISNFINLSPLPFFFQSSLPKDFSALLIFSTNQLFLLMILAIVYLISISLMAAVIFMISFFLLTLCFLCSPSSSCFRGKVRLFIWDFSCFLRWDRIAINFSLRTSFAGFHRFAVCVFIVIFSMYFWIFSLISSVITWLFSNPLFILHVLGFLQVFRNYFLISWYCGWESCLTQFQFS